MKLAWLSDIHLNFIDEGRAERLCRKVKKRADGVLISGDIAEAPILGECLSFLEREIQLPIWFVLGNHDLYDSSRDCVHGAVRDLCTRSQHLHWLDNEGVVRLTETVGLVGAGGWADGNAGDFERSTLEMTDFDVIEDFQGLDRVEQRSLMNRWAVQAAKHIVDSVKRDSAGLERLLVLTHVPPFAEVCLENGRPGSADYLPFYCSPTMGRALLQVARERPTLAIEVRAGHCHSRARCQPLPNLQVRVAGASYGAPEIQLPVLVV